MRVLHWYPNFLAGGGVANSVLELADAQAAAGAETWIASMESAGTPIYGVMQPSEDVQVATWRNGRALRAAGLRLHWLTPPAARAMRQLAPDVVHVHAEFNPDNWWAPRLWSCPLVLSPHGAFHSVVLERGARGKRAYVALARRVLYRRVARFHALNPAESSDLSAALPEARIYCVPQGPSPAVRHEVRPTEPLHDPVRFMFVGRVDVEVKGLDLLIDAFARTVHELERSRPAVLSIVGPDWNDGIRVLREQAARLGISQLVEFSGRVPADEAARLLAGCDVYVQLSRNEGGPLSLNDALVLGKPAIVSDRVGTVSSPEIARLPHVTVVPCDVDNAARAITSAVTNVAQLAAAARAARSELAALLSWEEAGRRHLQMYESLVGDPLGARARSPLG